MVNIFFVTSHVKTINKKINQSLIGGHHDQFKATNIASLIAELGGDTQWCIVINSS